MRHKRRQSNALCAALAAALKTQMTVAPLRAYCPHKPWPKQQAFLELDCEEAFFGGAAGGGKSDVLLMAALQYAHVPGYSALILRRDFARLSLAGAIMDRSKKWLANTDAKWNEQRKTWTFPSGATLQFGYIDNPTDRFRYASSEYQYIAWDELTEFQLADDESDEGNPYRFLFSRLRKTHDLPVPLRVRSASNPGNIGHAWVKRRFITEEALATLRGGGDHPLVLDGPEGRKFLPAVIRDNPALNEEQYKSHLAHLPPVTRARLMRGDWDVSEALVIPGEWLRCYEPTTTYLQTADHGRIEIAACRRFATIDTAGTSRDKADKAKGKPASWSVVAVWDHHRASGCLFLRHVWRVQVDWIGLKDGAAKVLADWNVRRAIIENAHLGPALHKELAGAELVPSKLPGMADGARGAKLDRAVASGLLTMLENGKLLLPQSASWLSAYQAELTGWSGAPEETCDQIDASSYAAWDAKRNSATWGGTI